ncbi:MAG TPA: thiolase family protein [Phycisphaerales bacterium]|nr:thiolase family protein [Phycisphaerales bacterium]
MKRAAIVAAIRTPVARYAGALKDIRPDDLAALVIREVIARAKIDPQSIDDIYFGAANQAGEDNRNIARMAGLLAGLPVSVPGATVNRLCASGLEAVNIAARLIEAGHGEIMIAGGVESMTRAPFVSMKASDSWDRTPPVMFDTTIGWRFTNPALAKLHYPFSMGETAENVARKYNISRDAQDRFALWSQQKWAAASELGLFNNEIIPVPIPPAKRGDSPTSFTTDEHPRPDTTIEKLAKLKPAFAKDDKGTVTAGNSSGINDGAAALVLVEESRAKSLGLQILGYIGASASAGVDPAEMGVGPVFATQKALTRAGMSLANIDIIEMNEAFAAQCLACVQLLDMDMSKINPKGGAIAIGHPLGCSGARLVVSLIHELIRTNASTGLATACIGVGQGLATVVSRT